MNADYYRDQAARARRLAKREHQLLDMVTDYDEVVADLKRGAIEVRRRI